MPKSSVTIVDVAKAAGVSVTTVSRVLNNKDDVSEETYQRVSQVIEELEYSSSLAARSMRSRKTGVIGVIMPDVEDPFSILVIKGVNRAIVELGYDLLIYTSGDIRYNASASTENKYVSLLNNSVTDGLIMVTPVSSSFSSVAPVVAVDPNIHNPSGPAVIATNFEGAVDATNHLIALGHRRIAFIGGRDDLISAHVRREAFEQTMSSVGIPLIPDLMRKGEFTTESGIEAAKELFSIDQPPTAIFAANDQSAIGVIKVAEAAGIRIPEDLSLVGFDNIPEAAYHNLTTIDQFVDQLGYVGTVMLVKLIKGIPLDCELETINTKLVIRGSSKSLTKRETGNKTGFMSSVKGTQRR
jgi:LacI family transcriptional regulator